MHIHQCPKCNGELVRVHRRPLDRLQSVVLPVRRFRCSNLQCQYEGNLRKTISTRRKLTLASAGLLGSMLAGALVLRGDVDWASPVSISAESFDASPAQYWADPRPSQGLVAFPAQPYLVETQCDSSASDLKTECDRVQPYAPAGN